jgi:thiamine biosynthesis lipoprotein
MQEISFHAMGCQMMAAVDTEDPEAESWLLQVPDWFEVWEEHLSRFRPESELSLINSQGGGRGISSLMAEVLADALDAQQQSAGLVNPLVLNALEQAGYDRDFKEILERTTTQQEPQGLPAPRGLEVDFNHLHLTLPEESQLDLGGVAKGWAADKAARLLGEKAPALVDAGGDVSASGPQRDGGPWPIAVGNPLDPDEQLDLVLLQNGGVATSGRDYRRWRVNGHWRHHIIDPRTGLPAATDVLSATVVGPSARSAETAAKTVLILGSLEGLRWLDERPELTGLIFLEDGTTIPSRGWLDQIWR